MGLVEASAQEGARRVALGYLEQAREACERLASGEEDPREGESFLHELRVGMRRLRSCLRAYDGILGEEIGQKQRRRLKRIAAATNPGRDAEVQREWVEKLGADATDAERAGVAWLGARMGEREAAAYEDVRDEVVDAFGKLHRRLDEGLRTYTVTFTLGEEDAAPTFGAVTADAIERQLSALCDGLRVVRGLDDEAKAHDARIHGKRLRYLVEPLRGEARGGKPLVRRLKALQDLLGDLNDLHQLRATTGEAIEETALAQARELRAAAEAGDVASALDADERAGLVGLLARVTEVRARRFGELMEGWLADGGELDALAEETRRFAATLRERDIEIERKYLLRSVPPRAREVEGAELDQGYLPGQKITERVRRVRSGAGEKLVRTVKTGRGMKRVELEERCEPAVFEGLWALTEGRRVRKRRYAVEDGDFTWEIDEFLDRDLVLAEVELPTEDTEVEVPEWLAPHVVREVTDDPAYLNVNLAR